MKRATQVYSLSSGYSPFIYKGETELIYCFPVSSGHADMDFEFEISEQDLNELKSSTYKFKVLYFILFNEAQSTFGTGNPNPRRYTTEEFVNTKNKVLLNSESELELYLKEFSKEKNLSEEYFQQFSKNVFGQ